MAGEPKTLAEYAEGKRRAAGLSGSAYAAWLGVEQPTYSRFVNVSVWSKAVIKALLLRYPEDHLAIARLIVADCGEDAPAA